ncbi:MAG: hypothetical protein QW735_00700 [archaeon]
MQIKDLSAGLCDGPLEATVSNLSDKKKVQTRYGERTVRTATLSDESGDIELTLWGDQGEGLEIGDQVKITNFFVKEWNGKLQMSLGKSGELKKI